MNYAGQPLLGRNSVNSARLLLTLSIIVIVASELELDLTGLNVLGVGVPEPKLKRALLIALGCFWISLMVNWLGDFIALGKWNTSMSMKGAESRIGGSGKQRGQLEFWIEWLEGQEKSADGRYLASNIRSVRRGMRDLNRSRWYFERYALFYVVLWGFLTPSGVCGWAFWELIYA